MLTKKEIFIAIIFFIVGVITMYSYNLNWTLKTKTLTEELVDNFRETYNIQRDLSLNYSNSYDTLVNCLFVEKNNCKMEEKLKEFEKISSEREQLKNQLEQKNKETEMIMSKFP